MIQFDQQSGFVAGTLVHTDKGLVPIECLKVGDMVLSKPENGVGEQMYKNVLSTFKSVEKKVVSALRHTTNYPSRHGDGSLEKETFYLTEEHSIWVNRMGDDIAEDRAEDLGCKADPNTVLGWQLASDVARMEGVLADGERANLDWLMSLFCTDIENVFWMKSHMGNPVALLDYRDDQQSTYFIGDRFDDIMSPNYMHDYGLDIIFGDPEKHPLVKKFIDTVRRGGLEGQYYSEAKTYVHSIEVADFHTYYVGEFGLWVHDASANIS